MAEITPEKIIAAKTKQVFCCECKHYECIYGVLDRCKHPANIREEVTHAGIDYYLIQRPCEKNGENNCKHFQKSPFAWAEYYGRAARCLGVCLIVIFVMLVVGETFHKIGAHIK